MQLCVNTCFIFFFNFSKSLADLSVWEPKTFESIVRIARERAKIDHLYGLDEPKTDNKVYIYDPSAERK